MAQSTASSSDFNSNRWYQILLSNETIAFAGTASWDGYIYGSVMPLVANRSDFQQQWQIYPFDDTYFVLRTRASGAGNYLQVMESFINGEGQLPISKPRMVNGTTRDASMLWGMGKWADGSFYLWNAANGTNWHFNTTVAESGHTEMISVNPQPKEGQAFSFKELAEINNQTFSTVNIPPSLAQAMPSTAAGGTSSRPSATDSTKSSGRNSSGKDSSSKDSSSASNGQVTSSSGSGSGLSTGAKAAIGVCAAVSIVILFALALFWMRRCRRRRQNRAALEVLKVIPQEGIHEAPASQHRARLAELPAEQRALEMGGDAKFEMDGTVNYEVGGGEKYEMGDGARERAVWR